MWPSTKGKGKVKLVMHDRNHLEYTSGSDDPRTSECLRPSNFYYLTETLLQYLSSEDALYCILKACVLRL